MPAPKELPTVDIQAVLKLRLLVGILGEKSRFGWWQTSFFDPTSQAFLTPIFAKSSALACYHGVVEGARRLHDEGLNAGSYHLFRLPEEMEQDLHAAMSAGAAKEILSVATGDKGAALAALGDIGGSTKISISGSGPVLLGGLSEFRGREMLERIARAYFEGFSAELKPIPYLTGTA